MATRLMTTSEARARAVLSLDGGTEYNAVEQLQAASGGSVTAYAFDGMAESDVRTPSAGVLHGGATRCTHVGSLV